MDKRLILPSGKSIAQLKRDADRLQQQQPDLTRKQALDLVTQQHAGISYDDALRLAQSQPLGPLCAVCGKGPQLERLLEVQLTEPPGHVHAACAHETPHTYGFCDVCQSIGDTVHLRENLVHRDGVTECDVHDGEFSRPTSEEAYDLQTLAEYRLNHPPED
jgi:hypothetical protein